MPDKHRLHELVEQLTESEIFAAQRYLEFLVSQDEAPLTREMLARIDAARERPS